VKGRCDVGLHQIKYDVHSPFWKDDVSSARFRTSNAM